MKYIFIAVLLCSQVFAQQTTMQDLEKTTQKMEEAQQQMKKKLDSLRVIDMQKQNERSYQWIEKYQKEEKRKQRQKATIRIGIGVGFLAILVIGLMRKRRR
jgi:hypothetical protein